MSNITNTTALLAVSKLKRLKVDWVDKRVDIITSYIDQQQKRIGELESKLIKQDKLLELYRYLNENTNDYDLNIDEVDEIHDQIYEIEEKLNGTKVL